MHNEKRVIVLKDFQHMRGLHCESTSLRKVLNHFGCEYEEEFLIGIAGGPGFVNWYMKKMDVPFIGTRNGKFPFYMEKACKRLHADMELAKTSSVKKSLNQVMDMLEEGIPAIAYGEIGKLPYMASNSTFGQHAFVVYGIDQEKEIAYISDRGGKPQKVALENYLQAHGAKCPAYSPNNAVVKITDLHPEEIDMEQVMKEAILDATHEMLHPPIKKFGLSGLYLWAEEVKEFESRHSEIDLVDFLVSTFINIETAGTGGKGFRQMYSRFLEIAAKELDSKELSGLSVCCQEVADAWRMLSYSLLPKDYFGNLADLILKSEAVFLERGNYDTKPCKELLKKIDDRMIEGRENSGKIRICLPAISEQIAVCAQMEEKFFTDLEHVIIKRG